MDERQLAERIRGRLAELRRTPIQAAKKGALERSYIRDFLNGRKRSIKREKYPQIAKGLDWTVDDLLPEESGLRQFDEDSGSPAVDIPEIDVRAGASYAGGLSQEEPSPEDEGTIDRRSVRAHWGIPVPFLRDELHLQPGRVHILPVRGDSMVDSLFDGDRVIVDLNDTDISQGGIFALLDDIGSLIIKQVEPVRGTEPRRIRCKSKNPSYEPFELTLMEPVRIIGRVASKISRL
jgi:hypothetical protein